MPLQWSRERNPYVHNFFRVLGAGPDLLPAQVVHLAGDLTRELAAGRTIEIGGRVVTPADIHEASSQLRNPESLAEERLLVHSMPAAPEPAVDTLEYRREFLRVLALLIESGALPECDPGRAGDEADCAEDIVFDS